MIVSQVHVNDRNSYHLLLTNLEPQAYFFRFALHTYYGPGLLSDTWFEAPITFEQWTKGMWVAEVGLSQGMTQRLDIEARIDDDNMPPPGMFSRFSPYNGIFGYLTLTIPVNPGGRGLDRRATSP